MTPEDTWDRYVAALAEFRRLHQEHAEHAVLPVYRRDNPPQRGVLLKREAN